MQPNHMTFGIDRRGVAIVATFLSKWPHLDHPTGYPCHYFLDMLAGKGWEHTSRAFGMMALVGLPIYHPDAVRQYVFEPITRAQLAEPDSNVAQLVLEPGVILPIHVAIGLSDDSLALEFAEQDDAHRALPGTVRTMPLGELAARGPDGAATQVGCDVLTTLVRLYPAVFAPYPQLLLAQR